jgi:drug/metabolite transporter (DMT)-like permease
MTGINKEKWTVLLAFSAVYIVWGSTYLAIWIGLNDIPPFLMSAIRFLVAGTILHIWCRWKGEGLTDLSSFIRNGVSGVLMLTGGTVSVAWAEQYLSSKPGRNHRYHSSLLVYTSGQEAMEILFFPQEYYPRLNSGFLG